MFYYNLLTAFADTSQKLITMELFIMSLNIYDQ